MAFGFFRAMITNAVTPPPAANAGITSKARSIKNGNCFDSRLAAFGTVGETAVRFREHRGTSSWVVGHLFEYADGAGGRPSSRRCSP